MPRLFGERRPRGFSLIELMVGITIIGILIASAVPALGRALLNAKNSSLKMNTRVVQSMIAGYAMDHNQSLPTSRLALSQSNSYQQINNPFFMEVAGIATWGNSAGASTVDSADKHAPITIWNSDPQPATNNDSLGTVFYVPYKTAADAQADTTAVPIGGDAGTTGYEYYTIEAMTLSELDAAWTAPLEASRMVNW